MKGRGARVAATAGILGLGVLLALAWSLREKWIEHRLIASLSSSKAFPDEAVDRLAALGSVAALPALIELQVREESTGRSISNDTHSLETYWIVQEGIRSILETRGPAAATALARSLESKEAPIRIWAARWLADLGPDAGSAVPALRKALEDPYLVAHPSVALALSEAGRQEEAIPVLIDSWKSAQFPDIWAMLGVALSTDPPSVPIIIDCLKREAWHAPGDPARLNSVAALAALGTSIVPQLIAAPVDRLLLGEVLAWMGSTEAVRLLASSLDAVDRARVERAIRALSLLGRASEACFPALLALARPRPIVESGDMEGEAPPRAVAIEAVARVGPPDRVLPELEKFLSEPEETVRAAAAHGLAILGADAGPARPALEKATEDSSDEVRTWARCALARFRPETAGLLVEEMRARLKESGDKALPIQVLGEIGQPAREAVPAIFGALMEIADHRVIGRRALSRIGMSAEDFDAIWKSDPDWQALALIILRDLGPCAEKVLDLLEGLMEDRGLRVSAVRAIGAIGPAAAREIPALERFLGARDRELRCAARLALLQIRGSGAGAR